MDDRSLARSHPLHIPCPLDFHHTPPKTLIVYPSLPVLNPLPPVALGLVDTVKIYYVRLETDQRTSHCQIRKVWKVWLIIGKAVYIVYHIRYWFFWRWKT